MLRIDTLVSGHGTYKQDRVFKETPLITGRREHFYRPSQKWLADSLRGWQDGYPKSRSDGSYPRSGGEAESDVEERERGCGTCDDDEDNSGSYNGWNSLPTPISLRRDRPLRDCH